MLLLSTQAGLQIDGLHLAGANEPDLNFINFPLGIVQSLERFHFHQK